MSVERLPVRLKGQGVPLNARTVRHPGSLNRSTTFPSSTHTAVISASSAPVPPSERGHRYDHTSETIRVLARSTRSAIPKASVSFLTAGPVPVLSRSGPKISRQTRASRLLSTTSRSQHVRRISLGRWQSPAGGLNSSLRSCDCRLSYVARVCGRHEKLYFSTPHADVGS